MDWDSLRVNIYDSVDSQFTIPPSVITRPPPPNISYKLNSDLVFNYESSPFAFWITRRSQPAASPLFDTRAKSLPTVPTGRVVVHNSSTVSEAFPFVFEKQYLQVSLFSRYDVCSNFACLKLTSALPYNTNVYGLGEVVSSSGFRRNIGPDGGSMQTMWARDAADPIDENL